MLNGSKAVKEMLAHTEKNQVQLASLLGITKAALTQRLKTGYYNSPGKLSEACDALGYTMELVIDCKLSCTSDGSQIAVTTTCNPTNKQDREA